MQSQIWSQKMTYVNEIATGQLRSFIEKIERLEEEKSSITADIKEIYSEAKNTGFDIKVIRMVIRLKKMDRSDRHQQEEILELYKRALNID